MDGVYGLSAPEALARLVGRRVRYQGASYRVRDALPDEGMLVLVADDDAVQDDAYGRPHRIAPRMVRLQVRAPDGRATESWREVELLPED